MQEFTPCSRLVDDNKPLKRWQWFDEGLQQCWWRMWKSSSHTRQKRLALAYKTTRYQKRFPVFELKSECVTCGPALKESCPPPPTTHPIVSIFEYLIHNWWCYLGRARRCILARGSVSLGTVFEVSKPSLHLKLTLSISFLWLKKWALSCFCHYAWSLLLCFPARMVMVFYPSGTINPKSFFYKLPWLWVLSEQQKIE